MIEIMLVGVMVVSMWKQCSAGDTTYWQQRREVEQGWRGTH